MKRLARILVCTLVLLELTLQAGAGYVFLTRRADTSAIDEVEGARRFLCVGDSFTYGVGSTGDEGSYPSQLERELSTRLGEPAHVTNAGWPGRNSAEALGLLDAMVDNHRPEHVFLLIGINDLWTRPDRVTGLEPRNDAPNDRFRWRYRTGVLAVWLWDRLTARHGAAGVQDVDDASITRDDLTERAWSLIGGGNVEFLPDGMLRTPWGPASWELRSGRLLLAVGREPQPYRPRLEPGGWLHLESEGAGPSLDLFVSDDRASADVGLDEQVEFLVASAATAIEERRFADAERRLADVRSRLDPADARQLQVDRLLISGYSQSGRRDELARLVDSLRERAVDRPHDAELALTFLIGLQHSNLHEETLDRAEFYASRFPENFQICITHARLCGECKSVSAARAALDLAAAAADSDEEHARVHVLRAAMLDDSVDEKFDHMIRACLSIPDDADCSIVTQHSRLLGLPRFPGQLEACLDRFEIPPSRRPSIRARILGDQGDSVDQVAILTSHLIWMIERCRAAGVGITLIGYPFQSAPHTRALEQVRDATGVDVITVAPTFADIMQRGEHDRSELFAADGGHCTDLGYGIIARLVAEWYERRSEK